MSVLPVWKAEAETRGEVSDWGNMTSSARQVYERDKHAWKRESNEGVDVERGLRSMGD